MIIDSPIISGSYAASGSLNQLGNVVISGSLTVTGSIIGTASFATTASYLSGYVSPFPFTGSAIISGSLEVTGSANLPNITGSLSGSLNGTSSYAVTASNAVTASYLTGYVSPFPFTGSAIISGSLGVSGSLQVTNLSGSGVRYLVADESGSVTAQSASAALKATQEFTSTAGQTTFSVTNGYSTGYVDVFINGSKLNSTEFTDTSGTNIVLATGSFVNDIVEVVKYTPAAGVTNNVLRQLTTFTASAGQTVFSASYTPGLIDIFYNGSRLSPSDFTANNGTFFTLATGSAANDILDVLVYSYQVGAFSGIGGVGTADQIAFYNTTNSITGSPNFTISGSTMLITGSLTISGSSTFTNIGPAVFSGSLTSTAGFTGSFSGTATSASYAANADLLEGLDSTVFTLTSSFAAFTASQNILNGTYATTGSNTFAGIQTVNSNLIVTGSITAQTLVVQTITSSVDFVTGSTRFGSLSSNTHIITGSMYVTGAFYVTTGSVGIGTTSPISTLSVATTSNTSSLGSTGLTIGGSTVLTTGSVLMLNFTAIGADSARARAGIGCLVGSSWGEGNLTFYTRAAADASAMTTADERMRITSAGNVGIGTITPAYTLDVSGSGRFTGLLTVSGFGTSNFSSAGTGYNKLGIRNTTAGVANGAQLSIGTDADPDQLYIQSFATTFTTSGMNVAGGAVINGEGPGGLNLAATQANIGFYTNGSAAANLRMNISSDGTIQQYAGTNQATGGAYNTFGNLYVASTTAQGVDIGGSISIGGKYNNAGAYATFARIQGKKENGSTGQTGGYLAFEVCTDVTNLNTERLRISSTGVATFTSTTTNLDNITIKNGSNKTNVTIGSAGGTAAFGGMQMYDNSSQVAVYLITDSTANSYMFSGLSIGASLASYKLQISTDSAGKPNGGSWANSSDIRLKENIHTINNALAKITQLRGVTFDWKDETEQDNRKSSGGFIADEVMLTFPNWVKEVNSSDKQKELINDDKVKSLSLPFEFDALLVEAIKEANAKITALEEKLERNNIN
jgi:hypothetical protein